MTSQLPESTVDIVFHPLYPDLWQVSMNHGAIKLQEDRPANPKNVQHALEALQRLRVEKEQDSEHLVQERPEFQEGKLLLAGQTFKGHSYGTQWIQTPKGYLPRGSRDDRIAKPFWPTYRVTRKTLGSYGVAPYVCSLKDLTESTENGKITLNDYDCSSPLRSEDLTKWGGYMFVNAEVPVAGVDAKTSKWWTHDGRVWWPKSVPAWDLLGIEMPTRVACIKVPAKSVMAQAVPITADYIKVGFLGRGYLLVGVILMEYLMIIAGVVAGIELGWSVGLQLVYVLCLFVLNICEVVFVGNRIPNGWIWMRMNRFKALFAILESSLSRWDLYSDVGFAVLAYQQRNLMDVPLWIGSTVLSALVIAVRLFYSFYYVRILFRKVDETTLAKVSSPSFMTLLQLLCETISSTDGPRVRKLTVQTELWFEAFLLFIQNIPEIGLQATYLSNENATPGCTDCAYGFVVVSFIVSVITALTKGTFRTCLAYKKYKNVTAELACENSTIELSERTEAEREDSKKLTISDDKVDDYPEIKAEKL